MTPPYSFNGSFSYPMYRSAQLLHLGWKKYLIVVVPILVIGSMAFTMPNQDFRLTVVSSLVGLLMIPLFAWQIDSKWKKVYKATPYFQYPYSGELSEVGYTASNQRGTTTLPWSDVTACKLGDDLLIFYQGPMVFHILSRSFFENPAQFEAAKTLIASRTNGLS